MVVFTCNHCGESLQKPRVEKHYQTSCRNTISVTCMDCFKDFKLQEYATHTKCITEEQRYSAKGTVPGGAKKGEMKQLTWVAQINNILETEKNLKPDEKQLLEFIAKNENVPRKKSKFINFMKSSSGGRVNLNDIEAVWNIIEKQKIEMANKQKENGENNKEVKENDENTENLDKKSKKKKKTNKETVETQISENVEPEETGKKSKKKKRKPEADVNSEDIKEAKEEDTSQEKPSKKKKRKADEDKVEETVETTEVPKKKKKKNKNNVQNGIEEKVEEIVEKEEGKKNKKKKKSETKIEENGIESKSEALGNGDINKKKKKKKQKQVVEQNGTEVEAINTEVVKEKKKSKKNKENSVTNGINTDLDSSMNDFSWQKEILAILKDTKKMRKHDLQKAVAKKFKKVRGEPPNMTQIKLFQRKLNKLKNVKCENDMVIME